MALAVDRVLAEPVLLFALRVAAGLEIGPHVDPRGAVIIADRVADLVNDPDPMMARVARLALLEVAGDGDGSRPARPWRLLEFGGGG